MIDFIKGQISYLSENDLLEHEELKGLWSINVSYDSGEIIYPNEAKTDGLKFVMRGVHYREFQGSLHKYYNIRNGLGNQNHNLFGINELKWVINDLEERFGILPFQTILHNLEVGVNINTTIDPQQILTENFICHNRVPFETIDDYGGKGYYKQAKYEEFFIKAYDKSGQYGIDDYLLRFEIKVIKMRKIWSQGKLYLSDLLKPNVQDYLKQQLIDEFNKVKLLDRIDLVDLGMNNREKENYLKFINPNYWESLNTKNAWYQNLVLQKLIKKYKLSTVKNEMIKSLIKLTNLLTSKREYAFTG